MRLVLVWFAILLVYNVIDVFSSYLAILVGLALTFGVSVAAIRSEHKDVKMARKELEYHDQTN